MEITGPDCLATHFFQISILIFIVSIFLKRGIRKKIQKWSLVIIIPTIFAIGIEDKIENYQYDKTEKSLNEICIALKSFKNENGGYPKKMEELTPTYLKKIPISGFGLFDSKIKYELLKHEETRLDYKVKFGFICEAYDCGSGLNFSTWARC